MSDYKHTLNLPKTDFPMKANLAVREPDMIKTWDSQNLYQTIRQKRKGQKQFILHDGPPYANGHLHCGHALNKILKDMIVKSKSLSGMDAPYVPGWDCHGLPIELNVEKKYGKAGVKISSETFRQKCREYAQSQIDIQRQEFKRLGVLGDWEAPYVTMDFHYEANIIRALGKIVDKGYLHQGFKPVHWCLDCRSALAEAEVEYENKTSPSIDVAFTLQDDSLLMERFSHQSPGEGQCIVPIWTTTPWTLPANEAIAVNPNLEYVLVQANNAGQQQRFLVAQSLLETVMARLTIDEYRVLAYGLGQMLEGLKCLHPFYDKEVPIVLGDHVTVETGTGCVHTAPAHGPDDYVLGQKYGLPMDNPVLANGCYADNVALLSGLHVYKANEDILELLKAKSKLLHAERLEHSYPHCWRHKTPIIFRATPQWFIAMDKHDLRQKTMSAIDGVEWIPEWGKARIQGMIENRPDWCISRQRSWGVPIPVFIHKQSGELHPQTSHFIEKVALMVEQQGVDAWFQLDPTSLLGEQAQDYDKVEDTLDVWFDSGVTHYCVLQMRPELSYPADLYLEGSDQHRGWFNSSLTTAMAINEVPPYRQVLTHGFTVDAQGKKMSKSRGNVITPEQLVKRSGADILRLWVAATDYRAELSISDEILKRTTDAYRRIRNTARFLLANLFDFNPREHLLASNQLLALDKWAIFKAKALQEEILQAYESYQFHVIYQKLHKFCSLDMGSFYLDVIKDRQYTCQKDALARRSCQTAMYHIIQAMTRWLAPILSFTAEEIWRCLEPGGTSVFLGQWYDGFPSLSLENMDDPYWQDIIEIRNAVNKALEVERKQGNLGSALEANVKLYCNEGIYRQLSELGDELRFVLMTSSASISLKQEAEDDVMITEIEGLSLRVAPSAYDKCARCWHRREDLGQHPDHPTLCHRCVENVVGQGEQRCFA